MSRLSTTVFGVIAAIALSAAGPAHAFMRQGAQSAPAATAASSQGVNLGPIVVTGKRFHALPLPEKLQMVKAALHRSINLRQGNLSKLVCRFNTRDPREAMRHSLHCETNFDILMAQDAFGGFLASCDFGKSAMINERLAASINGHRIERSPLTALLKNSRHPAAATPIKSSPTAR